MIELVSALGAINTATQVIGTAVTITQTVVHFCRGAGQLDKNLDLFARELESLQYTFDSLHQFSEAPDFSRCLTEFEEQSGNPRTCNFVQPLVNANHTLEQLIQLYAKVLPTDYDATWFERALKQNKLNDMFNEISQLRAQIQLHLDVVRMSLLLLNACCLLQNNAVNQANAEANRQNAYFNQTNAVANDRNAAATRDLVARLDSLPTLIQQIVQQEKDLGKQQDVLEATRRETGTATTSETRLIDDIDRLRRTSGTIRDAARRRISSKTSSTLTAAAAVSADFRDTRSRTDNAAITSLVPRRKAPVTLSEKSEQQNGPADKSERKDRATLTRSLSAYPDSEQRYDPADDNVRRSISTEAKLHPVLERSAASAPLLGTATVTLNEDRNITWEEFEMRMSATLRAAEERKQDPEEPFEDSVFDTISCLLLSAGKGRWSERPRTYLVLRLIRQVRAMEGFVGEGLSDIEFPYEETRIPDCLESHQARQDFLQKQSMVLTLTAASLVTGDRHRHIGGNADATFTDIRMLGKGGQGEVHRVTSKLNLQTYARKRIRKPKELRKDSAYTKTFENEVHNLKRLQHHHLVKFVGSYTDRRYVGIIMEPVADMDLKHFLTRGPFPETDFDVLRTFFGCLCSAVRYLHRSNCRHKDIKPANILIKDKRVYVTDFGIALDWTELGQETTEGPTLTYTNAYAAPEVLKRLPRDSKSDMWSLGCVFLDILTVLAGKTLDEKRSFCSSTGSVVDLSLNQNGINGWIDMLSGIAGQDQQPLQWIKSMLKEDKSERPDAVTLHEIISCSGKRTWFCKLCCAQDGDDDDDGDISDDDSFRGSDTGLEPDLTSESYTHASYGSSTFSNVPWDDRDASKSGDAVRKAKERKFSVGKGDSRDERKGTWPCANTADEQDSTSDPFLEDTVPPSYDEAINPSPHVAVCLAGRSQLPESDEPEACTSSGGGTLGYEGHAYWDKRIASAQSCRCGDCRSKNGIAANDLLKSAGFSGKRSFLKSPQRAWVWTMLQVGTLTSTNVESIVELLLDSGADIEGRDNKGHTFLHIAARSGYLSLTTLLIGRGADIGCSGIATRFTVKAKYNALDYALHNGHFDMMRLLLREGFNLNRDYVVNNIVKGKLYPPGSEAALPLLLSHEPDLEKLSDGQTALQLAVKNQDTTSARLLLEAGADANASSDEHRRALWEAISHKNAAMVDLLLEFKPDVHSYLRGGDQKSPAMHHAASQGAGDIVIKLLEGSDANRDVNYRMKSTENNILHVLARADGTTDNVDAFLALIAAGADVTAVNGRGNQPLHSAAAFGNGPIIGVLLENGAERSAKNYDMQTACDVAVANQQKDVAKMLGGEVKDVKKKVWKKPWS